MVVVKPSVTAKMAASIAFAISVATLAAGTAEAVSIAPAINVATSASDSVPFTDTEIAKLLPALSSKLKATVPATDGAEVTFRTLLVRLILAPVRVEIAPLSLKLTPPANDEDKVIAPKLLSEVITSGPLKGTEIAKLLPSLSSKSKEIVPATDGAEVTDMSLLIRLMLAPDSAESALISLKLTPPANVDAKVIVPELLSVVVTLAIVSVAASIALSISSASSSLVSSPAITTSAVTMCPFASVKATVKNPAPVGAPTTVTLLSMASNATV